MSFYSLFAFLSLFVMALVDNSRGNLLPLMQNDLKLSSLAMSFIFSGASLANFTFNFIFVRKKASLNLKYLYSTGLFLIFLSVLLFYFSISFLPLFFIATFIFGLGAGVVGTLCNIFITQFVQNEKQANYLSFLHSMYGIASFLVPLIITYLLNYFHWTLTLILLGLPSLLLSLVLINQKVNLKLEKEEKPKMPWKLFWVSCVFFCAADAELLTSSRLVDYLYRYQHFTFAQASFYLSIFFASLLTGRLLFSFVKFSIKKSSLMKLSLVLTVILCLSGIMIHPLFLCFSGFAMSWFFPTGMSWIKENFSRDYYSLLPMIMSFNSLSLLTLHFIVGYLVEKVSYQMIFLLPSLFCTIALIVFFKYEHK